MFFSLAVQVKELCWAEGRLAVDYPYSIISLVQKEKEKDVNEDLPTSVHIRIIVAKLVRY